MVDILVKKIEVKPDEVAVEMSSRDVETLSDYLYCLANMVKDGEKDQKVTLRVQGAPPIVFRVSKGEGLG